MTPVVSFSLVRQCIILLFLPNLLALLDASMVTIYYSNGSTAYPTQVLANFEVLDYFTTSSDCYHVTGDKPIQVAQFAESQGHEVHADTDPFMTILEPVTGFKSSTYRFTTMAAAGGEFNNTIHITIATADKNGLLLDEVPVTGSSWVDMTTTSHSIARVNVTEGLHSLSHSAGRKFSVFLYGQRLWESYAVPVQPDPGSYSFTAHARTLQEALVEPACSSVIPPSHGL